MDLIVVLDTNAYSDWRRAGRWHERLANADRIYVPSVVLGELFHGFRKGGRLQENLSSLEAFVAEPQVSVLEVTRRTAEVYASFLLQLRQQGTPIPTNDIWIAAGAHEVHGKLLTRDGHFKHLPQVRVVEMEED